MDDDFSVAASVELVTERSEFGDQFLIVVDLTVEDHHHRAVFVEQRLLAGRNVNDNADDVQRNARLEVIAPFVRPAMLLTVVHALHQVAREHLFASSIKSPAMPHIVSYLLMYRPAGASQFEDLWPHEARPVCRSS